MVEENKFIISSWFLSKVFLFVVDVIWGHCLGIFLCFVEHKCNCYLQYSCLVMLEDRNQGCSGRKYCGQEAAASIEYLLLTTTATDGF